MRDFLEKIMLIDRRWIYLAIGLAVIIPAIKSFHVPVSVSPEVKRIYDFVDEAQPGEHIFLCFDYNPSTMAEMNPMGYAILNQAFDKNLRVVLVTLDQFGAGMVEEIASRVAADHEKVLGKDYCFLGYRPYPAITILAMGVDFRVPFPVDYYGTPLDSMSIMQGVKNFFDVKGVIEITGGSTADFWIIYGNGRYGFPLALGLTGVMSADYYQYLQSGQIFGIIPGVKGAAEYESLVGFPGEGMTQMPYQVIAHLVILSFIVVSNVAYFATRKKKVKLGGGTR